MRVFNVFFLMVLGAGLGLAAVPVGARDTDGAIMYYRMKAGDTLDSISRAYLRNPADSAKLQHFNDIDHERAIPVGTVVAIPEKLLKYRRLNARLIAVRGNVLDRSGKPLVLGGVLSEGARIATQGRSFATLQLPDSSLVSLPSNSQVLVTRLRRYVLDDKLDTRIDLVKGSVRTKVSPRKKPVDSFHVRTPVSVSAVRGTEFRTSYEPNGLGITEAMEGHLMVSAIHNGNEAAMPAHSLVGGFGMAVTQEGKSLSEALLPEPVLVKPGKVQTDPQLCFDIVPQAGAVAYRVQLANDAGFLDRLDAVVVTGNQAMMDSLPDGRYFVKVTARSHSGIEGLAMVQGFRRLRNNVKGAAGREDDGWKFQWTTDSVHPARYRFQLIKDEKGAVPIVDEPDLTASRISIAHLPMGTYFWRVGSTVFSEGEAVTVWSDYEKLAVAEE